MAETEVESVVHATWTLYREGRFGNVFDNLNL